MSRSRSATASLALIGESGSGKSTIARSVLRLLPRGTGTATRRGHLRRDRDPRLPEARFRPLRGREIGFVPQDPANALNAVRTVGAQAHEAAVLAGVDGARAQREAILDAFDRVGLADPRRVYDSTRISFPGGCCSACSSDSRCSRSRSSSSPTSRRAHWT